MQKIITRRVYSDPDGSTADDGYRIFVDRLWPRGESKESFHYDLWVKNVAPSTTLREWFHADPDSRWEEFVRRYTDELRSNPTALQLRRDIAGRLSSHCSMARKTPYTTMPQCSPTSCGNEPIRAYG